VGTVQTELALRSVDGKQFSPYLNTSKAVRNACQEKNGIVAISHLAGTR
jgi:hypothetical protein